MSIALKKFNFDPVPLAPINAPPKKSQLSKLAFEKIAVIGLGYVGLPLATQLAHKFKTVIGFDISCERIASLANGVDENHEVAELELTGSGLGLSTDKSQLRDASFYIVAVPTPITENRQPDLTMLQAACRTIAPFIAKNDVIVFESTVFPGVSEQVCGKLLQELSGLRMGVDFSIGYSPERINPGDKRNTIETVKKVISGQNESTLNRIEKVYEQVVSAGLFRASSIKAAETAKILENVQRDVNIALMNEMSQICDKIGINSNDVIAAAETKWNFASYKPGLVGGHCIGVDPYYLAALAHQVGIEPELILAGRRVNENMVRHVAEQAIKILLKRDVKPSKARVGVFGITFKEDVPDLRNSKAVELVHYLRDYGISPLVHDPLCSRKAAKNYGIVIDNPDEMIDLDMMIIPSPHTLFRRNPLFFRSLKRSGNIVDVKGAFANHAHVARYGYWSL